MQFRFRSFCSSFLLLFLLYACTKPVAGVKSVIMVSIEPQRYFVEQIADTLFRIECMTPKGTSPETFDPTPESMVALSHAKIYFSVGQLGFENVWMDKFKNNCPEVNFFNTNDNISPVQSLHHHEHGIHSGIDPHVWTSPKQVAIIAENITKALVETDTANKNIYIANFKHFSKKLSEIDSLLTKMFSDNAQKAFVIYHPALAYFARDYGLEQYCIEDEGKEPSPVRMKEIVDIIKEKKIKTIFIQSEFDSRNAEQIAVETGCKLVIINPLSYDWEKELFIIAKALTYAESDN